jgi:hypothetical protein
MQCEPRANSEQSAVADNTDMYPIYNGCYERENLPHLMYREGIDPPHYDTDEKVKSGVIGRRGGRV